MTMKELRETMGINKLLSKVDDNPKLAKTTKQLGLVTTVLHLAPADLSGYNVCPMASKGCKAACLHTAGNPVYMKAKNKARIARTKAFFEHRREFMELLVREIEALTRKHKRLGIRLNGTSDIPWERVPVEGYLNIMERFPEVQFYDYTKRHNRKDLPSNYHLTYSLAEDNLERARLALENGLNVAAVFRGKDKLGRPCGLPESFLGVPVINGDEHDYRPIDPKGVVVGLIAKGKAKNDTSGFVQEA